MKQKLSQFVLPATLVLCAVLSVCAVFSVPKPKPVPSSAQAVGTAAATATPVPISLALPVVAVFGADDAPAFRAGIDAAAADGQAEIQYVSGGISALASYTADDAAAAIVYLNDASNALPNASIPVFVYNPSGQSLPKAIPQLSYSGAGAEQIVLDAAITYPPHLTPVRMIGLFSSKNSAAYAAWNSAKSLGLVFAKQEYIADESEEPLTDWLTGVFAAYFPGMLDAVYAETGAFALSASDLLASLARDDLEVFSAGADSDVPQKLSSILVCTAGPNEQTAGAQCYTEICKLFSGGTPQSGVASPELIWYTKAP